MAAVCLARALRAALGGLALAMASTLACAASAAPAEAGPAAAPLSVGAPAPELQLQDQHEQALELKPTTTWLLFTHERALSDMVNSVFKAEPAGLLERLQLVYVADISTMPGVVTRMFALPALRKLPYPVGLVRDGAQQAQVAALPRVPAAASLLRLEAGRVAGLLTVRNAAELRAALGLSPVP